MKRRTWLASLAAAALARGARAADPAHPIQVHVDMSVDPAKEKEMLRHFEKDFKPAAAGFAGYIDVKIVKLRSAFQGKAPAGLNYRFILNLPERRTAAEMDCFRCPSEGLGND